jgi:hypothetical protein
MKSPINNLNSSSRKVGSLDPYQSEKQDPDPYQKGLDPQHCFEDHKISNFISYF